MVQPEFVDFSRKCGVISQAYAPLSVPTWKHRKEENKTLNILEDSIIKGFSDKYSKTPAQIVLNWHVIHRGHAIIPSTFNKQRQLENLMVYDFKMSQEDY